jgi:uncharacterized PurR-regulated membrane protein YhhQ (DUF165 family)
MIHCFNRLRKTKAKKFWDMMHRIAIPSFTAGALLATVVFLLVPEAFEPLEHASDEEGEYEEEEG